ncbi:hypothetical protein D3C76_1017840 [compost metagenome]
MLSLSSPSPPSSISRRASAKRRPRISAQPYTSRRRGRRISVVIGTWPSQRTSRRERASRTSVSSWPPRCLTASSTSPAPNR